MADSSKEAIIRSLALYCENACSDSWVDQVYPSVVEKDAQEVLRTLCRQGRSFDVSKFEYIVHLLSSHVDLYACDIDGRSLQFECVYSGKKEMVEQLAGKYGLDYKHRDKFGRTLLHELFSAPWCLQNAQGLQNSVEILQFCLFLCSQGVNSSIKDIYGCSPLSLSQDGYYPHVAETLVLNGASQWGQKPHFLFYLACKPHLQHAAYFLRDISSASGTTRRVSQCISQHFVNTPVNYAILSNIPHSVPNIPLSTQYTQQQREMPHEFKRTSLLQPSCYGHLSIQGANDLQSTSVAYKNGDYILQNVDIMTDITSSLPSSDQGSVPVSPFHPITSQCISQKNTHHNHHMQFHNRQVGIEVSTSVYANTFTSASLLNTMRFISLASSQYAEFAECSCNMDSTTSTPTIFTNNEDIMNKNTTIHCPIHSILLKSTSSYNIFAPLLVRQDFEGRHILQVLLKYGCTRAFQYLWDILVDIDAGYQHIGGSTLLLGTSFMNLFTEHEDVYHRSILHYVVSHPNNLCLSTHTLFIELLRKVIVQDHASFFLLQLTRAFRLELPTSLASMYKTDTTSCYQAPQAMQMVTLQWISTSLNVMREAQCPADQTLVAQYILSSMEQEVEPSLLHSQAGVLGQCYRIGGLQTLLASVSLSTSRFSQTVCLSLARVASKSVLLAETICHLLTVDSQYQPHTVSPEILVYVIRTLLYAKAWNALYIFVKGHTHIKLYTNVSLVQGQLLTLSSIPQVPTHFPYICGQQQYVSSRIGLTEEITVTVKNSIKKNQLLQLSRISGVYVLDSIVHPTPPMPLGEDLLLVNVSNNDNNNSNSNNNTNNNNRDEEQTVLQQPSFVPRQTQGRPMHPFDIVLNYTGITVKFPVLSYAAIEPPVSTHSYRVMPVVSSRNDIFELWSSMFGNNIPFSKTRNNHTNYNMNDNVYSSDNPEYEAYAPPDLFHTHKQTICNLFSEYHGLLVLTGEAKKSFLPVPSVPSFSTVYRDEGRWCVHFPLDHSALYTQLHPYIDDHDDNSTFHKVNSRHHNGLACDSILPAQRGFQWQVQYANQLWNEFFFTPVVVQSQSYSLNVSFNPVLYSNEHEDVIPYVHVQYPGIERVNMQLYHNRTVRHQFQYNTSMEPFFQLLSSPKSSHCYSLCTTASQDSTTQTDIVKEWMFMINKACIKSTTVYNATLPYIQTYSSILHDTFVCYGSKETSGNSSNDSSSSLFTPRQQLQNNSSSRDVYGYIYTLLHTTQGLYTIPYLKSSCNYILNIQDNIVLNDTIVDLKYHLLEFQQYNTHISSTSTTSNNNNNKHGIALGDSHYIEFPNKHTLANYGSTQYTFLPTGLVIANELAPKETCYDSSWLPGLSGKKCQITSIVKPTQPTNNRFGSPIGKQKSSNTASNMSFSKNTRFHSNKHTFLLLGDKTTRVIPTHQNNVPNQLQTSPLLYQRLQPSCFLFSATVRIQRRYISLTEALGYLSGQHANISGTVQHEYVKNNMVEELEYFLHSLVITEE